MGTISFTAAAAPTLFSDLSGVYPTYQCCYGLSVSGYQAKGGSYTAANEFQVGTSGIVGEIDVAVSYSSGANSFYVSIWTDSGGLPGALLARWDNLSSNTSYTYGGCCGLATINNTGLSLFAGASYFMVLGPENFISDTSESWNLNSVGATGLDLYSRDGGLTWNSNGIGATLGAFDLLGSASGDSILKK